MLYESDEGETIWKRVCVCTNYTSTPTEMFHTPSLTKLLTVATIHDVLSDIATEFESSLASKFFCRKISPSSVDTFFRPAN